VSGDRENGPDGGAYGQKWRLHGGGRSGRKTTSLRKKGGKFGKLSAMGGVKSRGKVWNLFVGVRGGSRMEGAKAARGGGM